jgi:two-component system, sensor histidine kinase and response regulator
MNLFDTEGFPGRWYCGSAWTETPWLGWLHIFADIFTFLAYYAVPVVTIYFVAQRPTVKFPPIFYVFLAAIFLTCGTVHLLEAVTFWWPLYRFSALMKFVTAAVSCAGVVMLARMLPTALELKSGREFQRVLTERQKAQESLEHERFLLRTLLQHLPDAIYFKDTEGRFTRVSESLAMRLGCSTCDEVVGRSEADFFSPEFAAASLADEAKLMESGQPLVGRAEQIHWPANGLAWVSTTKVPLRDDSGRIVGSFGISHDVSEIKTKEEALRITEERSNLALKSSGVGTWSWDVAKNSIFWDDFIHPLFGLKPGTFAGHYEDFLAMLHVDDRDRVTEEVARSVEEDAPFDTEYKVVWPNGNVHVLGSRAKVYRDSAGSPLRMTGVCWDITERKRLEDRFRLAVEASPAALFMVHQDGRILLVNSRGLTMFGYSEVELIGQPIELLVLQRFRAGYPAQQHSFINDPVQRALGTDLELLGVRKDGSEFPVKFGFSPVETAEGPAVICGVIDITDQKKAMEAMRQAKEAAESASRAKSSFLANMSHEIRTPMNGIIGMAQLLAQTELRSHQRDYLATVDESAHILLRLLNDILDFSKIEAGRLELECVDFRISECVARATQMLVLRAAEKGLEIACRVAPEIPDNLRGDSGRVQQVLVNLLGNAVKFTEAGEIFVNVNAESITTGQVRLHISVSDTGIGIPTEKLDQIFRPFEQAESSTTRRFGGTGLGLAISRQLVEMMHGSIWIESEVGRGSTFHFTAEFGIAADQHQPAPAELESLYELPVLVVDDNFTNRRILNELLQHWHMQPVLADSAAAARQALQTAAASQRPIRLILLDHHMPGEDGIQFVESLRGTHVQCPIIMISSGTTPIDVDLGQKYGIGRFMTKPVIASELLNEVLRQFGRFTSAKPAQPPSTPPAQVQPRRVLLVEDNEINRRVAVGMMRSRGHQVVIAENGQEAVNAIADQEFDVVLMDMQMPVMDGYEATAEIRKREHQTGGHIPIVAMTAEALKGDRERCLAAGMDDYVSKPIVPVDMYRAIERFPAICLVAGAGLRNSSADKSTPTERHFAQRADVMHAEPHGPASLSDNSVRDSLRTINWIFLKESLGGGAETISEFSEVAKNETSTLLVDIRRAIETRDSKLLRRAAHTLKSAVAYFGAETLVQTAQALESLGHSESFAGTSDLLATLEREHAWFLKALDVGPPKSTS